MLHRRSFFVGGYSFRRRNSPEDTCTVCSKRVMNNVTQSCSVPLELETGIRIVECHKNTELPSSKIRANILYWIRLSFCTVTCVRWHKIAFLWIRYFSRQVVNWAAVSAGLSLVVLLAKVAIEKPFMCISGHFEQIKIDWKLIDWRLKNHVKMYCTFRCRGISWSDASTPSS